MKTRYRRSKRFVALNFSALVLSLASVFLVGVVSPTKAYAQDGQSVFTMPTASPLEENQLKIQELKTTVKTKAELIKEKKDEVDKKQQEVAEAEQVKDSVASEVGSLKDQIADLQAQLAEKQRLAALRIVPTSQYADDSAGNTYAIGNCTWYVKSMRPDLSNSLGNANTWYYRAQALGYKTGTLAKTGAIGTTTDGWLGHVVYVEKWLGNGQILISEMNYAGLYSTRERVANESEFVYIYQL